MTVTSTLRAIACATSLSRVRAEHPDQESLPNFQQSATGAPPSWLAQFPIRLSTQSQHKDRMTPNVFSLWISLLTPDLSRNRPGRIALLSARPGPRHQDSTRPLMRPGVLHQLRIHRVQNVEWVYWHALEIRTQLLLVGPSRRFSNFSAVSGSTSSN